ncbi:unnamed protein product [Brassica oleracea]
MNSPFPALPPIEKQLWSDLWRTKTSPKLRHFLGASWFVRDEIGNPVIHSRRAFSGVLSELEASLRSLAWSIMALSDLHLDKVIIEFS